MTQASLFVTPDRPVRSASSERDRILAAQAKKAGPVFRAKAAAHILEELRAWPLGRPGEALTWACREAGIVPPGGLDDRAFGPVFRALSQAGRIVQVGTCERVRGHGAAGGRVWRLK